MGAYNELLKKYGVAVPFEKPEDPPPEKIPSVPDPKGADKKTFDPAPGPEKLPRKETHTPKGVSPAGDGPGKSMPGVFTGTAAAAKEKPAEKKPPERKPPAGKEWTGHAAAARSGTKTPARGTMPGVFGGGKRDATSDEEASVRRREARMRREEWLRRLPPLWGVDLVLILITLAGVILIATHLQAVLLALARLIINLLRILFWIAVLAGIGVFVVMRYGRRRRR